jgi:hypothetical protein
MNGVRVQNQTERRSLRLRRNLGRRRVFDVTDSRTENLIRLDPSEAPHFGAPGRVGFHLIDTTMMFAPRSGGVKRYLLRKNGNG